jgi:UDP-2-acetamido-2,6-beta-L-arabino-hexul-4-ose reductase
MQIVITGADGFVARNLAVRLKERGHEGIGLVTRQTPLDVLEALVSRADLVFHLAGVNRPQDPSEFTSGNVDFTARLCELLRRHRRKAAVVFSSSIQAALDNPYGRSKEAAEQVLLRHALEGGGPVHIYRLPNVFGKWARPNYNSAVATFCHNVARGLPIVVHDPAAPLRLVYVDDVIDAFVARLDQPRSGGFHEVQPVYETTVGEVAEAIREFARSRDTMVTSRVGVGLLRALHATYLSHLPSEAFAYEVPRHQDPRGVFVEMLKTPDCGQFSYFTAHPGVTRGEHYHHTKTEKFLVIKGTAHFGFRHIVTGETHELVTRGGDGRIVETIPGWTHNITNVGDDELIVMLWANEIFDRQRPDTVAMKVKP